jgi:hypothetical protein
LTGRDRERPPGAFFKQPPPGLDAQRRGDPNQPANTGIDLATFDPPDVDTLHAGAIRQLKEEHVRQNGRDTCSGIREPLSEI